MPSNQERRAIDFFIRTHNTTSDIKIVNRQADKTQEAPDAICLTESGISIGLELTSAYPPKGTRERRFIGDTSDTGPIRDVLTRKLERNYKIPDTDQTWLVMQIRRTLPPKLLREALADLSTTNYERVVIQCPMFSEDGPIKMGMYILNEDRVFFTA